MYIRFALDFIYKRKIQKGDMIKKMLKIREVCDTYLTHICRNRWSRESPSETPYISSFHQALSDPAMSTDRSQVGDALFPLFNSFNCYTCICVISKFQFP